MKRLFAILTTLILVISAFADTTTDKITATTVTLDPGSDAQKYIVLSLDGESKYTAYSLDVELPQDVDVVFNNNVPSVSVFKNLFPYTEDILTEEKTYTHSATVQYNANSRILSVVCISTASEEFVSTSGRLIAVILKASTFAKPGTTNIKVKNIHLIKKDATDYTTADVEVPVTISTSATAAVSVSGSANWSTCILPFATAVPNGVEAYTCDAKDDAEHNLLLTKSSTIAAYTPYILYSESGFSGSLSGTVDASLYPESGIATAGYLNGSLIAQSISEGYVLQNGTEGVMFYQVNAGSPVSVPAGKCWVTLPADATAKAYGFAFSTSGIGNLVISDNKLNTPNIPDTPYTLSGIKVNNPQAGKVYILGGKKQIIR